jgi:hypothetical protein
VAPKASKVAASATVALASAVCVPRNSNGMTCRNMMMTSTIAAMNVAPRAIAAKPARRVSALSPRPTAWPTRTVAAMEMPNGTMKRMEAVCSAI